MNLSDMPEAGAGLQEGMQTSVLTAVESIDLTEVGQVLNTKLGESMSVVDMSESGAGLQAGVQASLNAALENIDLSGAASGIHTKLTEALTSAESVDMSAFTAMLQSRDRKFCGGYGIFRHYFGSWKRDINGDCKYNRRDTDSDLHFVQ